MNRIACALTLLLVSLAPVTAQTVLVEAEQFADLGGWDLDQQCMDQMGSPYLLAHGLGVPVKDAVTTVTLPKAGTYHVWARTRDWVAPWQAKGAPGRFQLLVDGQALATTFGTEGAEWHWQDGGTVKLGAQAKLALHDLTGFEGRCDALVLSADKGFVPPAGKDALAAWRRTALGLPEQPEQGGTFDLVVVGGGIAGTSAAVSAARQGIRVALIQDRPVLGGNGSSEVRVWPEGRTRQRPWRHVGDIVEELTPAKTPGDANAGRGAIFADQRKLDIVAKEPRITLLLEQRVNGVEVRDGRITAVIAQNVRSAKRLRIAGRLFADCTGDGTVGYLAGADYEVSKEGVMGSSNLWNVLDQADPAQVLRCECKDKDALSIAVQQGQKEAPFPRCPWALDLHDKSFPGRKQSAGQWSGTGLGNLGGWFWESGFDKDQVADIELIRDNNFRAMYGAWDTLKNVDKLYPNHRLGWAAYIAGKRESRRLLGDVILTGGDFRDGKVYPDACFPCSWHIDVHSPDPRYTAGNKGQEFISLATQGKDYTYNGIYWAPYRSLYSRNIANLFMAGRDISATREALGATRVMRTTGMMGEIVGKAAYLCVRHDVLPRGVYETRLDGLKELMAQPGPMRRETLDGPLALPPGATISNFVGAGLDPKSLPGIVVDDEQADLTSGWSDTGTLTGFVGSGYYYASDEKATARFPFQVKESGTYEVRLAWQPHVNRAKALPVTILTADGEKVVKVDQTKPPTGDKGFGVLGQYRFEAGRPAWVLLTCAGAQGAVHCDAIQVVKVP
ncbi:MAG: FAD-dependent oxidoreductase [Armatimonadetes bacterium]|nr:FAD-dependent oxidoreductase [Armatimonadota bacterium]